MREPPGAELLRAARDAMQRELLPIVPVELRYRALMVARAMAIAERELRAGEEEADGTESRELAALLAAAVRDGEWDAPGEGRHALREYLLRTTARRVRETNPRYLEES